MNILKSQTEKMKMNMNQKNSNSSNTKRQNPISTTPKFSQNDNYMGNWKLIGNERKPKIDNQIFNQSNKDLHQIPTWKSSYSINFKKDQNKESQNKSDTKNNTLNNDHDNGQRTVEKEHLKPNTKNFKNNSSKDYLGW